MGPREDGAAASPSGEASAATQGSASLREGIPAPSGQSIALSVVVPLCNESPNVLPLAQQVFQAFQNRPQDLELILVDDASTDGTWEQVLKARALDHRARALRHLRRSGQSAALWTGFSVSRGEIIATLDGDLQNDPADLPRLLAELDKCDMVCGVRKRRMDNGLRRFSTAVARWARRTILKVDFQDTGCNLRVFKRSVLRVLFAFDGLHRFMPILVHEAGGRVLEIPVAHHPRTAGDSKYGLWNRFGRGIFDLAAIAWYRKRQVNNVAFNEESGAK